MKQIYFALFLIFIAFKVNAQIVNIPDDNFKTALINHVPIIDTNSDGEIQVSEAEATTQISVYNADISDLSGIEAFINLEQFSCPYNQITNIDLSSNSLLTHLHVNNNELNNLDISNNTSLVLLNCSYNQITNLDLSNNLEITQIQVHNNQIVNLDLTNNTSLYSIDAKYNEINNITLAPNNPITHLYINDNTLTNINLENASQLEYLHLENNQLTSIELTNNSSLQSLYIENNNLNTLDISSNLDLWDLNCSNNNISSLDLSNNSELTYAICSNNLLIDINTGYINLWELDCSNNQLSNIDVAGLNSLYIYNFSYNPNLIEILIKNGNNFNYSYNTVNNSFDGLPNLQTVCVDDSTSSFTSLLQNEVSQDLSFTEYCSFTPGGAYYTIQGDITLDTNLNGCDSEDSSYPQLQLNITDGSNSGAFYGNNQGNYNIPIQAGNYTITPQLENTTYFSVSPNPLSVNFPSDSSPFNQDFCITPNGTFNDVEIVIIPLELAIPGFEAEYKLLYKNKGTTVLSGSINLNFDDNHVDFQSATPSEDTQATGSLSWNYSNLQPFETREVVLSMLLNTPTDPTYPLNSDNILSFTASITPSEIDETPEDNTFSLEQVVVNSYDPNDKTCLEGETITLEQVGKYVHYLIRFENNGTANAVNIVVKDIIDETKFDVSTLIPLDSSHDFFTRVQNDNEVEFIFEDIQLPFDDENNDGYILFKIKTLDSLDEGDSFSNQAEIYFDFNFPIITNNETTTIVNGLSTADYLVDSIRIYPNPANDRLYIDVQNNQLTKATITDINGRLVLAEELENQSKISMDVSSLTPGIYFVNIQTINGSQTVKMVKQ